MVKKLGLLCVLLSLGSAGGALAETRFSVKADKKIVVLGESLQVELKVEDAHEPLSSINLDSLKRDFNVFGISSNAQTQVRKGRRVHHETMSLILYPLRSGKIVLPAFIYMKKTSKTLEVIVTESAKQSSAVIFKTSLDSDQAYVRKASTLTLDIYDDGLLQWTAPGELVVAGVHQAKLAESQFEETVGDIRYTVHRYRWSLMPLREGVLTIAFPLLDAFKLGARLRYPIAPLSIKVAPVPTYLPVHVPIGKLQVTSEPMPDEIALGRPVNWTLKVQGDGLSAEGLQKLLQLPGEDAAMQFYPAVIREADHARPVSAQQTFLVTLPFVAAHTGAVKLPTIYFPYYDTELARVESVVITNTVVSVFNPVWRQMQKFVLGLFFLIGLVIIGAVLFKKAKRFVHKRKALKGIANAKSVEELQHAILKFGQEDKPNTFVTLQQWLNNLQKNYHVNEALPSLIGELEAARYGINAQDADVHRLAHWAAALLSGCRIKTTSWYSQIFP
jgi:BatD DUF11 like domain